MKISIIIPAYNEAAGIAQTSSQLGPVLLQLRTAHDIELIFVNDGSKDETLARLKQTFENEPNVKFANHEVNRGLGAALRTGFGQASGDILITTDFDGTYSFDRIPDLLDQLIREKVDIVTASPYHPNGKVEGVPAYQLLFSFGASLMYRLLVDWRIYCWTALFRAYRAKVIQTVSFDSNDFLAGTELLVNALRSGFTVSEYPATLRIRTFGQSSMKIARVTLAHLRFQLRILRARVFRNRTGHVSAARG